MAEREDLRVASPFSTRVICFGEAFDDADLENVLAHAAANSPAIVLVENLDSAFPRSGQSKSKVHLQTLLNALAGVATEPGVIAVATANDPSLPDPVILRRPGRFDRVVHFSKPDTELRREYLARMHPRFAEVDLAPAVAASTGFSYALLRAEVQIPFRERATSSCKAQKRAVMFNSTPPRGGA